jgi:hypothetical protein
MDITSTAVTAVISAIPGALIAGWTGGRAITHARRVAREDRRRRAAESLRDTIWELRDLVWGAMIGSPVDNLRVATASAHAETTIKRFEDILPDGARHLRRSCREAVCNVFGGPGAAGLSAHAAHMPTDQLEPYWADVALTWLEHAANKLHQWEDEPSAGRLVVHPFHLWRRDEDAAWRADSRAAT